VALLVGLSSWTVLCGLAQAQSRPPLPPLEPSSPSGVGEAPASEGGGEAAGPATTSEGAGGEGLPEAAGAEGFLPRLDLFFPEGELNLRVNRLVNKVFFEGQLKYNFLEGDITAFLRYRYYGYRRTFQVTAFDSVEFDDLEELSDEFSRVRGLLGLLQWPHSYHRRTFLTLELDRLISNKEELQFTNNRTNSFVRLGLQIGTPRDGRSNSLVTEQRARVERLFTPFRDIGPRGAGFTTALTYGFDFGPGDFDYVKVEFEGLKRFQLSERDFLVARIHGGTFPLVDRCAAGDPGTACEGREDAEIIEANRYSTPRSELFRLDGRENLKGLKDRLRGTDELHSTLELFLPGFLDAHHKALGLEWTHWYWVVYGGVGTIGFDREVFTHLDDWVPDLGVGFESSFRLRKYRFFLSGLVAQALNGQGEVEAQVSLKSYR
jgi:hypothetical protein